MVLNWLFLLRVRKMVFCFDRVNFLTIDEDLIGNFLIEVSYKMRVLPYFRRLIVLDIIGVFLPFCVIEIVR